MKNSLHTGLPPTMSNISATSSARQIRPPSWKIGEFVGVGTRAARIIATRTIGRTGGAGVAGAGRGSSGTLRTGRTAAGAHPVGSTARDTTPTARDRTTTRAMRFQHLSYCSSQNITFRTLKNLHRVFVSSPVRVTHVTAFTHTFRKVNE
ncbi:hypothetical protein AAFF_G00067720 [Aldrovandia affinis]|uniref:Uncharacterized protein n=1 Tax=Aldrovandia affinis TaxID=143900 RepID=A0AAD7WEK3_9TELE|nr:hypothetical protein AAFF_G00067720 [Aldrovandia affinis]